MEHCQTLRKQQMRGTYHTLELSRLAANNFIPLFARTSAVRVLIAPTPSSLQLTHTTPGVINFCFISILLESTMPLRNS